ncbi:MAG: nucleotidyltransferase family protein [Clostridia bacterium]|nr:nucleotidyltransferase family protein [Clostridia bacterium]
MKIAGIIAEYNPMHTGHMYQLNQSNADAKVIVMSGNFVQRGEPALWDKWTRAKIAIENGADLVLELPVSFAVASAERFALGGVSVLARLGVITHLIFGAENPLPELTQAADTLSGKAFDLYMKQNASTEKPYHEIRNELVNPDLLKGSNNILGIEYLKAIKKLNATLIPEVILRKGAVYNQLSPADGFASASYIRDALQKDTDCSAFLPYSLPESKKVTPQDMFPYLKYKLLTEDISEIAEVREGVEHRIQKCILSAENFEDLLDKIKTKRYTRTAISRMLTLAFLGISKQDLRDIPQYTRVLAANQTGCELLNQMRKCAKIPIITKGADGLDFPDFALDVRAGDLYALLQDAPLRSDFEKHPYIKK